MDCPQCHNDTISSSGICLACGFQTGPVAPDSLAPKSEHDRAVISGMIEVDYAESTKEPEGKGQIPEWRRELSDRLKTIRQKREQMGAVTKPPSPAASTRTRRCSAQNRPAPAKPAERARRRPSPAQVQEKPAGPIPQQKTLKPLKPSSEEAPDAGEVQKIIDEVISRQPIPAAPSVEISLSAAPQDTGEGKLILLSGLSQG